MQTRTLKTKISGLIRLFRFELPFTAGVCVVLGEILAFGKFPPIPIMALGFLSVFFISAASLILNVYFDRETDKINAPHRPLPAGLVTERDVILLFNAVTALGFVAGGLLGASALATAMSLMVNPFTVQPFGNAMITLTVTGAQIDTLLEQQFVGCGQPALPHWKR